MENKEAAINYARWLAENCSNSMYNTYQLKKELCNETGRDLYYLDSQSDMDKLYNIYLNSDFYKNSNK